MRRALPWVLACLLTSGCAALNPYDEEPYCKARDVAGRCTDAIGAYSEAVSTQDEEGRRIERAMNPATPTAAAPSSGTEATVDADEVPTPVASQPEPTPRERYLQARDARLASILDQPKTPLMSPPKVLRILLLPYASERSSQPQLHMQRFTYVQVEAPQFVLGDYLTTPR